MIGKSSWFQRRKYGGWGITPRTSQGWLYILISIILLVLFRQISAYLFFGGLAVLMLDILHIMATLKKDELETRVEALAERNGAWTMIAALIIGIFFQVAQSASGDLQGVDPFLLIALFSGAIVKSISNWWLERKGIDK